MHQWGFERDSLFTQNSAVWGSALELMPALEWGEGVNVLEDGTNSRDECIL